MMSLKDKLNFFVMRADELADHRLVRDALNTGFSLNWRHDSGLFWESREPDEDLLRSGLMLARQFISPGEPIFIDHIHNECERNLRSDDLKTRLRKARRAWATSQNTGWLNITIGGQKASPAFIAHLLINGRYFHADVEKHAALAQVQGLEAMLTRQQFLAFVADIVGQVLYLRNVIKVGLHDDLFNYDS